MGRKMVPRALMNFLVANYLSSDPQGGRVERRVFLLGHVAAEGTCPQGNEYIVYSHSRALSLLDLLNIKLTGIFDISDSCQREVRDCGNYSLAVIT